MAGTESMFVVDQASLRATQANLRLFAPDVLRKLRADIKAEGEAVTKKAAEYLRSRSQTDWRTADYAAAHYIVRQRVGGIQLYNRSKGASIVEYAGHVSPAGKSARGATLISTLNQRYGSISSGPQQGRVLWRAFNEARPELLASIDRLVAEAEAELNARLRKV